MPPGLSYGLLVILLFILGILLSPSEYCLSAESDAVVDSCCISSGVGDKFYYSLGEDYLKSGINLKGFMRTHGGVYDGTRQSLNHSMFAKLYAIKTGNRFLAGHFAIKIWVKHYTERPETAFRLAYLQMEDENTNAIGEFLRSPPCKDTTIVPPPAKLSTVFFTPCSQANPSDNEVPLALTFVLPDRMENEDVKKAVETDLAGERAGELILFVRFSHTSCNKPKKVRIRGYITNDRDTSEETDGRYSVYRSKWIHPNWVGAADIVHPHEKDSCSLVEIAFSSNRGNPPSPAPPLIPWIEKVDQSNTEGTGDPSFTTKHCKPIFHRTGWDANRGNQGADDTQRAKTPSFAGRCKERQKGGNVDESVKNTYMHDCSAGLTGYDNFTKYSEYLEKRKGCFDVLACPCQCRSELDVYALGKGRPKCRGYIPTPRPNAPPGSILFLGYETTGPAGVSVMKGRKAHGIVMTLISMTFVPISIMISRYFKETWLPRAHLQIVQVWYGVHVVAAFFTICLYLFGMIAMLRSRILLGHSMVTAAVYHILLGQGTIILFFLVIVLGPLRPTANSPFRMIMMMTHALLGGLYYILGMITVVLSQWIPGSPSADDTTCIYLTETFTAKSTYRVLPLVAAWVIIDFLFHILFTMLQCMLDKRAGYKRKLFIPLLSILKGGEEKSPKGSKLRTLLFIIYCVLNVGISFTLIGFMIGSKEGGCGFGPTSCTHSDISTFLPADICKI
ncbi:Ferric-chelate reductase 1 [Orchesella cincta]|uniref:Ferric-chelate reductase 1 n=1 Tax=Orchesella cincta TaxID=48709 RepID=A0A1D2M9B2_ORCCI|nr:Ferric-chelate reductase 1 [Orchesella cincta]